MPAIFIHSLEVFKSYDTVMPVDMYKTPYITFKQARIKNFKNVMSCIRKGSVVSHPSFEINQGLALSKKSVSYLKSF